MLLAVSNLRFLLDGWDIRNCRGGPDLAVRMGIARTHHGSAIFKDLDIVDLWICAKFLKLLGPAVYNGANIGALHP